MRLGTKDLGPQTEDLRLVTYEAFYFFVSSNDIKSLLLMATDIVACTSALFLLYTNIQTNLLNTFFVGSIATQRPKLNILYTRTYIYATFLLTTVVG